MSLDNAFSDFSSVNGRFFKAKQELKAGQGVEVTLLSIDEQKPTRFPIKGKDYCLRLTFELAGERRIMDVNSFDGCKQAIKALYPNGKDGGPKPGQVTLARRIERAKGEGDLLITRANGAPATSTHTSGPDTVEF